LQARLLLDNANQKTPTLLSLSLSKTSPQIYADLGMLSSSATAAFLSWKKERKKERKLV